MQFFFKNDKLLSIDIFINQQSVNFTEKNYGRFIDTFEHSFVCMSIKSINICLYLRKAHIDETIH